MPVYRSEYPRIIGYSPVRLQRARSKSIRCLQPRRRHRCSSVRSLPNRRTVLQWRNRSRRKPKLSPRVLGRWSDSDRRLSARQLLLERCLACEADFKRVARNASATAWRPPNPAPAGIASSSGSCRIVPEAQSLPDQGQKYTVGFENAFGARGSDFAQLIENKQNTTGYVGQAARPPGQGRPTLAPL